MSNEDLFNEMSKVYPIQDMMVFCRMSSLMYNILYKDEMKNNRFEPLEFNYDAQWWAKKYLELMDGGC